MSRNIFNGLFIVAVATSIHPITVSSQEVAATWVFGFLALVVIYPSGKGLIE